MTLALNVLVGVITVAGALGPQGVLLFLALPGMILQAVGRRVLGPSRAFADVGRERIRVWSLFSDLFLDTDVTDDIPAMARILAESPYGERELWEILADEVAPVVWFNFLSFAGEWAGFNEEWLKGQIVARGPSVGRAIPGLRQLSRFPAYLVFGKWRELRRRVHALRAVPA